jgi:hypothetical protein
VIEKGPLAQYVDAILAVDPDTAAAAVIAANAAIMLCHFSSGRSMIGSTGLVCSGGSE